MASTPFPARSWQTICWSKSKVRIIKPKIMTWSLTTNPPNSHSSRETKATVSNQHTCYPKVPSRWMGRSDAAQFHPQTTAADCKTRIEVSLSRRLPCKILISTWFQPRAISTRRRLPSDCPAHKGSVRCQRCFGYFETTNRYHCSASWSSPNGELLPN